MSRHYEPSLSPGELVTFRKPMDKTNGQHREKSGDKPKEWCDDEDFIAYFRKLCNELCPPLGEAVKRIIPFLNDPQMNPPAFADDYIIDRVRKLRELLYPRDLQGAIYELEPCLRDTKLQRPPFATLEIMQMATEVRDHHSPRDVLVNPAKILTKLNIERNLAVHNVTGKAVNEIMNELKPHFTSFGAESAEVCQPFIDYIRELNSNGQDGTSQVRTAVLTALRFEQLNNKVEQSGSNLHNTLINYLLFVFI